MTQTKSPESKQMHKALIAPFPAYYVKWLPKSTYQGQAMAVCYIDARSAMDRLDDVFGCDGWKDEYQPASGGGLNCRLWAYWPHKDEWTYHEGFGEPGGGSGIDSDKSAESDSLKRAAVKFGIGRYLYRISTQWVDCELKQNGKFKRFKKQPTLPDWAIPKSEVADERPPYQEEPEKEKPTATKETPPQPVASDAHWIDNEKARSKFWALVKKLGLDKEQAHNAFQVDSMKQYTGTMVDAKRVLIQFACDTVQPFATNPELIKEYFSFLKTIPDGPSPAEAAKKLSPETGNLVDFDGSLTVAMNVLWPERPQ